jgi:hypothetical protein
MAFCLCAVTSHRNVQSFFALLDLLSVKNALSSSNSTVVGVVMDEMDTS